MTSLREGFRNPPPIADGFFLKSNGKKLAERIQNYSKYFTFASKNTFCSLNGAVLLSNFNLKINFHKKKFQKSWNAASCTKSVWPKKSFKFFVQFFKSKTINIYNSVRLRLVMSVHSTVRDCYSIKIIIVHYLFHSLSMSMLLSVWRSHKSPC